MPRIPDEEIDRLKRVTDLAALVRSRGVELHKHGSRDLIGRCPFHDDKETSFVVTPEKGLFHCPGCGAAGNAIQFVERFDGLSFRHAFELLTEGRGFTSPATSPQKVSTVRRLETPLDLETDDAGLMSQVVDYYHERLLKTPAALDYLRGRGLCHEEALEKFRLGFADRTLGLRLPDKNRKDGEAIRTRLQKLGILRESGHEHFNGSVVLPIYSGDRVTEVYGRKINDNLRTGTPKHLYLPGPHEGIWNEEAMESGELILCEAVFDALTFWVNNFRNVTFIYGTNGFTDELFDAILNRHVKRVRLAYDADASGNKAAARDAERLMAHGVDVFRVKFPWGMDVNEYARKVQSAGKALETALNAAEWIGGGSSPRAGECVSSSLLAAKKEAACPEPCRGAASVASPSVESASSAVAPALERAGDYYALKLGPRGYRVGGLEKNTGLDALKVSLRVRHEDNYHLDSFDLAQDGQRRRFIERAAEETRLEPDLIKRDLGKLLLLLEEEQAARLSAALKPETRNLRPELTAEDKTEALAFLKSPDLVEKIGETFDTCGLVGEQANRLAAYLACTSRKLEKPLAVIIQSTSAAGKSTLMEAVLAMFPEEERVKYSAMTGQSLYYLGEMDLKHKILAIVEEEGAEKASYALKLLQSEGELTIASTGKDPHTGRMETQEYHVQGPVMVLLATTAVDIDEELENRCFTLSVDESREQTERIHALQRKARTLEGLRLKKKRRRLLTLLRNAQRLLMPVDIVNPYANELTFTADRTRTRRDHEKYLTLIDAVALLHQYQRTTETDAEGNTFIRVILDDIALANRLAPELLGKSLDELPPQTRRLLLHIKDLVRAQCKEQALDQPLSLFSRRQLSVASGWRYSQIKRHLFRLQESEYIAPRVGRVGVTLRYELLMDMNEPDDSAQIGLLDVEKLRVRQPTWTGEKATWTPPCQNEMARLEASQATTNANLATLPARTSGAALKLVVS
jgi:DNA primase